MPFYTPRGLKIRLDPDAVQSVLDDSGLPIDLDDAYMDLELWARFPNALCAIAAILTALISRSVLLTLVAAGAGFVIANMIQQFTYSPALRIIFPQFLGAWPITVPLSIACASYLYFAGSGAVSLAVLGVVVCTVSGMADLLLLPLMPLRILLHRTGLAPPLGDVELAFMIILDQHAARHHGRLDWEIYDRECAQRL